MTAWTNLVTSIFKKNKKTKKGGKPYSFKDALKDAKKVYKKNKTQKGGQKDKDEDVSGASGGKKMKKEKKMKIGGIPDDDEERKRLSN